MPSILLTAPAAEPLTLAEAKDFLRVEHGDDDGIIAALITGARGHVEAETHRALITQGWRLVRDCWPDTGRLALLPVPLREITAARVRKADGGVQDIDVAAFAVDAMSAPAMLAFTPGALLVPGRRAAGIEIDIVAGYGDTPADVPEALRQAIRLLVAHWYENRRLVAAAGETAVMPATVASLLSPYKVHLL